MSIYMHNETFTPFGMEEKEEKRREMNERREIRHSSSSIPIFFHKNIHFSSCIQPFLLMEG